MRSSSARIAAGSRRRGAGAERHRAVVARAQHGERRPGELPQDLVLEAQALARLQALDPAHEARVRIQLPRQPGEEDRGHALIGRCAGHALAARQRERTRARQRQLLGGQPLEVHARRRRAASSSSLSRSLRAAQRPARGARERALQLVAVQPGAEERGRGAARRRSPRRARAPPGLPRRRRAARAAARSAGRCRRPGPRRACRPSSTATPVPQPPRALDALERPVSSPCSRSLPSTRSSASVSSTR